MRPYYDERYNPRQYDKAPGKQAISKKIIIKSFFHSFLKIMKYVLYVSIFFIPIIFVFIAYLLGNSF